MSKASEPAACVYRPWAGWTAKALSVLTLLLIFAGGIVTSKNVGLSVPDWPTSLGYHLWAMPFSMWRGGVFYEHSHRLIAMLTGFVVMVLMLGLLWKEPRAAVRRLALASFALVVIQGIFGGLTVKMALPTYMSVLHGVCAQVFLGLTVALAYLLSREHAERKPGATTAGLAPGKVWLVTALVLGQLVLAAYMRHNIKHQGGVAIPDFPTTAGAWIPRFNDAAVDWVNQWREDAVWNRHGATFDLNVPIERYQMVVHFAHRCMAAVILAGFVWLTLDAHRRCRSDRRLMNTVWALDALLATEVCLGILTVWSNKGELLTSLHVATGAGLLAGCVLLAMRAGCGAGNRTAGGAA